MVYIRTSSNMGVVEWLDDTWDIPDNTVKYIQSQSSECKSYTDEKISSLGVIPQIVYVPNEASMPNPPVEGVLYLIGNEVLKQIIQLKAGWNYVSFYLDGFEGEEGLSLLQEQLVGVSSHLKTQNSFCQYDENVGWYGSLTTLTLSKPIQINADVESTLEVPGNIGKPENYPITLVVGVTYIPCLYSSEKKLNEILINYTPTVGDYIKDTYTGNIIANYTSSGWDNNASITPGKSYSYYNASSEPKTLIFPKL